MRLFFFRGKSVSVPYFLTNTSNGKSSQAMNFQLQHAQKAEQLYKCSALILKFAGSPGWTILELF
jgi:hypothetical protein